MGRDQRVRHNHALLFAAGVAKKQGLPLYVVFCILPEYLNACKQHYDFMFKGLMETSDLLSLHGIPLFITHGDPVVRVSQMLDDCQASMLVMDFDPLRHRQQWKASLLQKIKIPLYEVDAHNIVPCWIASPKAEFGAYTLRPKIHRVLHDYLDPFDELPVFSGMQKVVTPWEEMGKAVTADSSIVDTSLYTPGETAAHQALQDFIEHRLSQYPKYRNDPNMEGQSGLSPWIHFGQLSAQYIAQCVQQAPVDPTAKAAYLEELIVRRELSDNFCLYNPNYDTIEGFPAWARTSLEMHRKDERVYVYDVAQWEQAETHDDLWNAAQQQLLQTGKMHGYMRMYWAKKILEWSADPETAIRIAVYLNDHYSIDGRDPNSYAGIMWSLGGLHDRAWGERPVYGKVRYMNAEGCKRKFDVKAYISRWKKASNG
jgi:deoxyribodipyrimidine photo-lyase